MDVYPLSLPKVDWNIYIETFKDAFGRSPASALDYAGMDTNLPASFVSSLDFENETSPSEALRQAAKTMILHHSFCSFIYVGDRDVLSAYQLQEISIRQKSIRKDDVYAILTGTIAQWRDAIAAMMRIERQEDLTDLLNIIYDYLCQAGYKEIW